MILYFLSAIGGNILSAIYEVNHGNLTMSVGASGAIFGLFGAMLYFGYNYRGYIGTIVSSQVLPIVIYNLIMGYLLI